MACKRYFETAVDEGVKIYTIGIGQNIQKNVLHEEVKYDYSYLHITNL